MWERYRWFFIWLASLVAFLVVMGLASGLYTLLGLAVVVIISALVHLWAYTRE